MRGIVGTGLRWDAVVFGLDFVGCIHVFSLNCRTMRILVELLTLLMSVQIFNSENIVSITEVSEQYHFCSPNLCFPPVLDGLYCHHNRGKVIKDDDSTLKIFLQHAGEQKKEKTYLDLNFPPKYNLYFISQLLIIFFSIFLRFYFKHNLSEKI